VGQWINWKRLYNSDISVHRDICNRRFFLIISRIKKEFQHILYTTTIFPNMHYNDSGSFVHNAYRFSIRKNLHRCVVETRAQHKWNCFALLRFLAIRRAMDTCSVPRTPFLLYQFDILGDSPVQFWVCNC
jgi:hypothetical protein